MYFVKSISEGIWKYLHCTFECPFTIQDLRCSQQWQFMSWSCWWPTFWTNILTLSSWPKFPLDVGALCHSSKGNRNLSMVWELQHLYINARMSLSCVSVLVLTVCQCWMCGARSYDSTLSTEGTDLGSFMSRKCSICQLYSKFLPLHENNK